MTFCLGMKCEEGLLAIADTRITSGTETSIARKIAVHQGDEHCLFILTSGLRSIRDKALTYFEERLDDEESSLTKLYEAANVLADELRRVREEDARWLIDSGLAFDLHCIVGGQLSRDTEPHLYLLYPEGNWIEVRSGTPYVIIGESRYGKPILDRAWSHDQPLLHAPRRLARLRRDRHERVRRRPSRRLRALPPRQLPRTGGALRGCRPRGREQLLERGPASGGGRRRAAGAAAHAAAQGG